MQVRENLTPFKKPPAASPAASVADGFAVWYDGADESGGVEVGAVDLKENARKLKRDVPAVFLAMRRKETPVHAKLLGLLAVGYALSPVDLIPDFIPVLGYLDDVILLPLLVALAVRAIPAGVMEQCRAEAEGLWEGGKPKKWICAVPVLLIWLLLALLIVRAVR